MDRSQPSAERIRYGLLLRLLLAEKDGETNPQTNSLTKPEAACLARFRRWRREADDQPMSDGKIELPAYPCRSSELLFHDEANIFRVFTANPEDTDHCQALFVHLNNCFACAEMVGEVLREMERGVDGLMG